MSCYNEIIFYISNNVVHRTLMYNCCIVICDYMLLMYRHHWHGGTLAR